jgi:glycosyltransferase A (GT-A) superfamily protein (DUF2064 family)
VNKKTAILIFANSAEKEATLKPFLHSKELFEQLNSQTLKIVKKTGLTYFLYSEKEQVGNNFGERFTNAIESVYNKGFDCVITIGNDTPHLTTKHILKTVEKLQKDDFVLGPSIDGGFYLMGLNKNCFNLETFLNLPWQSSKLNNSICKLLTSKKLKITYLEFLKDIDLQYDITSIFNNYQSLVKAIKVLLIKHIFLVKKIYFNTHTIFKSHRVDVFFNKGSPLFSS